jgi:hypothetical protein
VRAHTQVTIQEIDVSLLLSIFATEPGISLRYVFFDILFFPHGTRNFAPFFSIFCLCTPRASPLPSHHLSD